MRNLYSGQLEKVTLFAREPNMKASVTHPVILYDCRWSRIVKAGQQLDDEQTSDMNRMLHIPRAELQRVGVNYINPIYQFMDQEGRYWQAESDTPIVSQLWENVIDVNCHRIDPTGLTNIIRK